MASRFSRSLQFQPFLVFINPTPTTAITPLPLCTTSLQSDRHVRKWLALNMTHRPRVIIAERAIFLLSEMAAGAELFFFLAQMGLIQRLSRPDFAVSQLRCFHETTANCWLFGCRHTSALMRWITIKGWRADFVTGALGCYSKLHLKCMSSNMRRSLVVVLTETIPFKASFSVLQMKKFRSYVNF